MAVAAADMRQHGRVRARLGRSSLLAWSAIGVMIFAALVFWFDPARLLTSLGDTDDATRMIEVREWMAGASWFDITLPRRLRWNTVMHVAPPDRGSEREVYPTDPSRAL